MKKLLINLSSIILLLTMLPFLGIPTAFGYENYTTSNLSPQEATEFLTRINFLRVDTEATDDAISCFAISENGLIALGFNSQPEAAINVYNNDGQFLYGYRFLNNRCALVLFFHGENLSILWGKSNYVGSFDSLGNCLQFEKLINDSKTNLSYHADRYKPSTGSVGKIRYYATNSLGFSSTYSGFSIEADNGSRINVYDAGKSNGAVKMILGIGFILVACTAFLIKRNALKHEIEECK